ncbi:LysM repeat protein [Bacillus mesophilus]|uniref:LysM peptidoglycan-binding domain-containing protein n=1 Tax=Bacillus mesophilus TaxID=1808955 RepID=A0A6M0Q8C6_9BACI|nr:LysM peptidoglycan-binding domain-containing protein [Bacillus mesophilus]MBM7661207.1 LysM repeat protein [Bacillus mesophilus]NEY71268.1 LysM peptidoglycan-binding domain-containing protein [Bacillus mesophilus]
MSDSNDHRDQAQDLRERMNKKEQDSSKSLDALSLPPRSKVHQAKDKEKKPKFKFRFPLLRFLTFVFVLLPIAILGYTFHQQNELPAINELSKDDPSHSEKISIATKLENREVEIENKELTGSEEEADREDVGSAEEETTDTSTEKATTEDYNIIYHEVKEGETLYSISQYYYKSRLGEELIKEWNKLSDNKVENGKILQIPLKSSK